MSSISQQLFHESETQKQHIENINSIFNSKLFLYLDNDIQVEEEEEEEKELNNDQNDFEENNFLSNELIKELNSCLMNINISDEYNDENKLNNNIINSLISLAKDGYEFKPKNYYKTKNNKNNNKNYHFNNLNFKNKNRYNKHKNNKKNFYRGYDYINDKVSVV